MDGGGVFPPLCLLFSFQLMKVPDFPEIRCKGRIVPFIRLPYPSIPLSFLVLILSLFLSARLIVKGFCQFFAT